MILNMNMTDRVVRVLVGFALILYAVLYPDAPYAVLGWIGVVPLATGLIGWCGLYKLFGISTAKN